jgi:hypothetical protein
MPRNSTSSPYVVEYWLAITGVFSIPVAAVVEVLQKTIAAGSKKQSTD